jgi:hypothetical protein
MALGEIVLNGILQVRGMPKYPDFSDQDVDAIYYYIRWRARKDLGCLRGTEAGGTCSSIAN